MNNRADRRLYGRDQYSLSDVDAVYIYALLGRARCIGAYILIKKHCVYIYHDILCAEHTYTCDGKDRPGDDVWQHAK